MSYPRDRPDRFEGANTRGRDDEVRGRGAGRGRGGSDFIRGSRGGRGG